MGVLRPKTEAEWNAESDAESLMQAAAIRKDSKRLKAARKVIKAKLDAYSQAAKS